MDPNRPRYTEEATSLKRSNQAWIRAFAAGRRVRSDVPHCAADVSCGQRAWVDIAAAWHRWHGIHAEARFRPEERPYIALFDRVRVERLAAKGWPGMASNLADAGRLAPSSSLLRPLYLCARILAEGGTSAARTFVEDWDQKSQLSPAKSRPRWWLRLMGKASDAEILDDEQFEAVAAVLRRLMHSEAWEDAVLQDASAFAKRLEPVVRYCAVTLGPFMGEPDDSEVASEQSATSSFSLDASDEDPNAENTVQGKGESDSPISRAYSDYSVYRQAWDETASAVRWYQPSDRQFLERLHGIDRPRARRLAHRLQRRLQVARRRTWQFDQEEGLIDSRRIARLLEVGANPRVFRSESESPVPEACVSLLVDMSGSIRGDRRLSAALAIDLAVHVLETCGIQSEVLGFTTRFGEDNPIERQWHSAGRSGEPGRLNAIRHIIFKSARQRWRRCRPYLGLLLRDGFGEENIDGEAVHWAAQRLFGLDVSRRLLIVLSDGAPFDQATSSANGREFLCEHLRTVVRRLEELPINVLALGTGTDVSRFYAQAVVLDSPDAVAETLFAELGDLLTRPKTRRESS